MNTIEVNGGEYSFQDVLINGVNTKCLVPKIKKPKFTKEDLKSGFKFIYSNFGNKEEIQLLYVGGGIFVPFSTNPRWSGNRWRDMPLTSETENHEAVLKFLNKECERV